MGKACFNFLTAKCSSTHYNVRVFRLYRNKLYRYAREITDVARADISLARRCNGNACYILDLDGFNYLEYSFRDMEKCGSEEYGIEFATDVIHRDNCVYFYEKVY